MLETLVPAWEEVVDSPAWGGRLAQAVAGGSPSTTIQQNMLSAISPWAKSSLETNSDA